MRIVITLAAALGAVLCADAYTESETNEVVRLLGLMVRMARSGGQDCFEDASDIVSREPVYRNYEDLFRESSEDDVDADWTPQERQAAFESFLWHLPDLTSNDVDEELLGLGNDMLDFCEHHNKTNFLPIAERVLLSPHAENTPSARRMFEKFARPSEDTYRFVECMMTNRTETFMTSTQSYFLGSFGVVLLNHRNDTSPDIISNGVRLIRRSIVRMDGWNIFDYVMRKLYPDYAMSSNRLAFAVTALDAEPTPGIYGRSLAGDVRSLFTPITNTLLNASEPLKVLDLSWLDESTTTNANETEQQEENHD